MIAGLFEPPAALLAWFYSFTHNYIIAISMIALVIMIITAPLVLKLEEEGKLTLNDPLSKWLPDFPNITNTITLRQLLNHTSGVYDWFNDSSLWPRIR